MAMPPLRVLLVDPSRFTGPYDMALGNGLSNVGVSQTWAVRPLRPEERDSADFDAASPRILFYRGVDRSNWLPRAARAPAKGVAHVVGLLKILAGVLKGRFDVVHFQWTVVPALDALAIRVIRKLGVPVVLTVHDTVPFNGENASPFQISAFTRPIHLADRVIVHTATGRQTLIDLGIAAEKIRIVAHGPLAMTLPLSTRVRTDRRYTFVLFGQLKRYKGVDLLVEAVRQLPREERDTIRVVVAGAPHMDMTPIVQAVEDAGLASTIELKLKRLSDAEMADLFAEADSFVFPYRQIDASGVFYLVRPLGKWIIASRIGVFADEIEDGVSGSLVPTEDVAALAREMARCATAKPSGSASRGQTWDQIAVATRAIYSEVADH